MSLLDEVLDEHGGADRWRNAGEVRVHVSSGGLVFRMKAAAHRFPPADVCVAIDKPRVVLDPYPKPGRRGIFEGDHLWIESERGGKLAERTNARRAFRAVGRRALWWDQLDSLYFAGYALWNYLTTPLLFTRPGVTTEEAEPWQESPDQCWRRLRVTFPPDVPTHSREQLFYFDEKSLLRRFDYTVDVIGSLAKSAHYVYDYQEIGGLLLPTRHSVVPRRRSNRAARGPTLVWLLIGPS